MKSNSKTSKNTYLYIVDSICFLSLFSLLKGFPIISLYLLFPATIFFFYRGDHKNIFIIWVFFFSSWYFVFTACMLGLDSPIWIGGEYTSEIFKYLSYKLWYTRLFEDFCIQTVTILDFLSSKLGFPLYIPSLLKWLLAICKLIFEGRGGSA